MKVLETNRLVLRCFTARDLDDFAPICADPEVMRYYKAPWAREKAEEFIERWIAMQEQRGYCLWAVIHKEDGRFIGFCGLVRQQVEGIEEVEVGYMLDRAYWGRGLATEAARASRDYGFERLGLRRLISLIHPDNRASIRVAEKNGMRYERDAEFNGRLCRVYAIERRTSSA